MSQTLRPSPIADPAVAASELIFRVGLFVLAVAVPVAAVFSRRTIFSLTPIGVVLMVLGSRLAQRRTLADFARPLMTAPGFAVLFLAIWSGLSLAWSPWLASGGERFWKSAGTLLIVGLAGALAPSRSKASNLYLLPLGCAAAALSTLALVLDQRLQGLPSGVNFADSTLARAAAGVLLLAWPALAALAVRQRRIQMALLAVVAAAAVLAVGSPFLTVALVFGGAVGALGAFRAKVLGRALGILLAAAFALAPLLVLIVGFGLDVTRSSQSFPAAAAVATFVKTEGLRLVTGHGLDSASRAGAAGLVPWQVSRSVIFETWYELGLVGALAAALLALVSFRRATVAPADLAPFLLGALTSGSILALAELPSAQEWWLTLVCIAALMFALVRRGHFRTRRPRVAMISEEARPRQSAV